ncbi:CUGBP Elav-like family member 1 [Homalodisca vitripennis]|uniref:CUGBP Elav-like family member 1 n=1 Tax=Homalodisca vitripennis TaxID=197043 RepID=UPI001EEBF581|nr:CUGBP Elav-like family member 1 [Homalodisca vitripennis]
MEDNNTNPDMFNQSVSFIENQLDFEVPKNESPFKYENETSTIDIFGLDLPKIPSASCKPDVDSIKMFVGQIPQNFTEYDLLQMFEKYGKVYDIRVLKDKTTGKSKGCCFVTFFTRSAALNAQNALHNIKVMPGMHHPIQMKPADTDNRNDRKLFVGMLSKKYTESEVRNLFSPYGTIEECTVLRDANGQSKGCAFITYLSRQSAQNAVKSMHHCHIFEGCSSPIVVKFADTQKEKEIRRFQILQKEISDHSQITTILQQLPSDSLAPLVVQKNILQQFQNPAATNTYPQIPVLNNLNFPTAQPSDLSQLMILQRLTNNSLNNQILNQNLGSMTINEVIAWNNLINKAAGLGLFTQGSIENAFRYPGTNLDNIGRRHIEGPDGANLFIYHLPPEFTDEKLAQLFNPYGKVISAKVFIDKVMKQSKGFGFVSYDNVLSANIAIQNLNGYQILGKKLKVEVKKKRVSTC